MAEAIEAGWDLPVHTGLHDRLPSPCSTGLHQKQILLTNAQAQLSNPAAGKVVLLLGHFDAHQAR